MLSNLKGYFRPKSIAAALALLEKNSGSILVIAGGTKLVKTQNHIVQELVDISSLGLNYVTEATGEIRIGATTSIQHLVENPVLKATPNDIISEAAGLSHRSRMIRNGATVGGELVSSTSLSVLYCAMLVLQAQVRIVGGEEFALAINIFLNKKGLGGGLLVEIIIPKAPPRTYAALAPLYGDRKTSTVCAAARLTVDKGVCSEAKIAMTGSEKIPRRLHQVENFMAGQELSDGVIAQAAQIAYDEYQPISDHLASEEFRKEVGHVILKKTISRCFEQASEDL